MKIINVAIGRHEDNDMTNSKIDMPYTRKLLKRIAMENNLKKPYKFIRSGFKWNIDDIGNLHLIGYFMLKSSDKHIIRSRYPAYWLDRYHPDALLQIKKKYHVYYIKRMITGRELVKIK